ncbi:MAG: gliding motility protein GldM [Bacteroidota bacterium]
MAGGKLSPRQQMINMMYLVLTALLAMNVSKEILDSFITINKGQETTRKAFEGKLSQQYGTFQSLAQENPKKYGDPNAKAQKVKAAADEIVLHINKIKAKCIAETEGLPIDSVLNPNTGALLKGVEDIKSKDNYDVNTNLMIGSEPASPATDDDVDGNNYRAIVLKQKLMDYANIVKNELGKDQEGEKLKASITELFNFSTTVDSEGDSTKWETLNFYHVPLAATTSILSKLQSDIRNAESDAIGYMFADVEKSSYKFTELVSAVIPQSTNVTTGASYEADVFLAAYDGQNVPTIQLGKPGVKYDSIAGQLKGEFDILEMDGTKGKVQLPGSSLGPQHREGCIIFTPVGGQPVVRGFALDYNVVAPTLVVSPTKMNVFYRGVDNPVSVGVPGFTDKDVTASCEGCQITKASDGYMVRVNQGTEAKIYATATLPDGGTKRLGPASFRIKSVPDPVPQFAGKGAGDAVVKKAELTAAQGVIAKMKDFEFDLKFTVTQFKMGMVIGGQYVEQTSKSNRVTADMKTMMKKAKRGQKVFIEGIKAKGPDGKVRNLGSLAFKVN